MSSFLIADVSYDKNEKYGCYIQIKIIFPLFIVAWVKEQEIKVDVLYCDSQRSTGEEEEGHALLSF